MPRYFFNVSNSLKVRDPTGIMLADDSAAFSHAHRLVRAIATDGTKSMLSASVMVMNEAGEQVLKLPVAAEPSNAANSATRRSRSSLQRRPGPHGVGPRVHPDQPGSRTYLL
jgi:hypothetical protein